MRVCICWTALLGMIAVLAGTAAAAVPPVSFLTPDRFTAGVGEEVVLHMEAGTAAAAQTVAWPADRLSWLFIRAGGTQKNRDTWGAMAGQPNNASPIRIAYPGVTVVGVNTKAAVVQVPAADLKKFLLENVAEAAERPAVQRLTGQQDVRVRRIASATTMVRVPDAKPVQSGVALSKTGQAAEIRPLFDPTMLTVGADFPLRIYVDGDKKTGAKVRATSLSGGGTTDKLTDPSGSTYFTITKPGAWRIEFNVAEPLEGDADADWVLYSGTLTFEVAAEGVGK